MQLQKYEAAKSSVLRACDLDANDSENWLVLSSILRLQQQPDEAGKSLQRWKDLNERHATLAPADRDLTVEHANSMARVFASIYRSMAVVYQSKGQLDKSQTCFQQSLAVYHNDAQALAGLAALHRRVGNLVKAVESNRKLLQIQPNEHAHYQNLANLAMEMGRPDVAEAVLRLACLRMPQNGTSYLTLARLLLLLKKNPQALQAAQLAHDKLRNAEAAELLQIARNSVN
jgi:tetratricopeptide (TPR) repeat protein